MRLRAQALAASLVVACGGGAALERSAPERPAWVELTPAARDSLYFVGICSELPSYQEALRCARGEALIDVAAWVGARFSSYVYDRSTEETRAAGSGSYLDADLFLADVRRSDTYHEVSENDFGTRSYYVSVLLAYPRAVAEQEKARIEETTFRAERMVEQAVERAPGVAGEGRWGAAMEILVATLNEVVVPRNLHRAGHTTRLASLAESLVTPLQFAARVGDRGVELSASYGGVAAAGVPLGCYLGSEVVAALTDQDGRAVCELPEAIPGGTGRVIARPDITGYLDAVPSGASEIANALGRLLDRSVTIDVGEPLDVELALAEDGRCGAVIGALREQLEAGGVRLVPRSKGVTALDVTCDVQDSDGTGELYTATARATLSLESGSGRISDDLASVNGLGATRAAAREEATLRLVPRLTAAVMKLLRDLDVVPED